MVLDGPPRRPDQAAQRKLALSTAEKEANTGERVVASQRLTSRLVRT